ncbi:MAG TPA: LysR substrate-binding domain-containing protein [Ramlibacter sp.]|uniref:LysR substrate-binding domain-containing protein n=1 Tax=Ramlibacter sp. TaxID=1917967 RepID=UPI002C594C30|nr:LysR substrate-binding domain-containing protein [Ramlibacter sp.]HVZ44907.1 LysR substrate-binding domain-containing protein [Ramlibacter sp.]
MTVNFKTLSSFVKAVDCKSLSGAAQQLSIAQPALSQQISLLEQHFQQKLLIRSKLGVTPTDAGRELYRHALIMLKQLEAAEYEVPRTANVVRGRVSVGLATYSSVSVLAAPLLRRVREEYPHINLFINDNFGLVLSELVMSGAMDMAVIYGTPAVRSVKIQPLLQEELFLIAPPDSSFGSGGTDAVTVASLRDTELLLPGRMHLLRQLIDRAFDEAGVVPRVAAEIESVATMREAIAAGLGATILPWAVANTFKGAQPPVIRRVAEPTVSAAVSLCVPEHKQVSEAALAVADILAQLVRELASSAQAYGIEEAA